MSDIAKSYEKLMKRSENDEEFEEHELSESESEVNFGDGPLRGEKFEMYKAIQRMNCRNRCCLEYMECKCPPC